MYPNSILEILAWIMDHRPQWKWDARANLFVHEWFFERLENKQIERLLGGGGKFIKRYTMMFSPGYVNKSLIVNAFHTGSPQWLCPPLSWLGLQVQFLPQNPSVQTPPFSQSESTSHRRHLRTHTELSMTNERNGMIHNVKIQQGFIDIKLNHVRVLFFEYGSISSQINWAQIFNHNFSVCFFYQHI